MSSIALSPVVEVVEDDADVVVFLWREEQFVLLGFGPVQARRLAKSQADLGLARRLQRDGCSVDVSYRILV